MTLDRVSRRMIDADITEQSLEEAIMRKLVINNGYVTLETLTLKLVLERVRAAFDAPQNQNLPGRGYFNQFDLERYQVYARNRKVQADPEFFELVSQIVAIILAAKMTCQGRWASGRYGDDVNPRISRQWS